MTTSDSSRTVHELPFALRAAREARTDVAHLLAGRSRATIEIATLLTSELVTNAVVYGSPPVRLGVHLTARSIRVEVHDSTRSPPMRRPAGPADTSGRGLAIVDALASRWGTEHLGSGKCVWFEVLTERG